MMLRRLFLLLTLVLLVGAMVGGLTSAAPRDYAAQDKFFANAADAANGDELGASLSMSADGLVAISGAPLDDSSKGSAYVFTRAGSDWTQQDKLVAGDGASGDSFGHSVAISGNGVYAIVGAKDANAAGFGSGTAYIFKFESNDWVQKQEISANDGEVDAQFGVSVAINNDGSIVMIGADGDDAGTGAAYVFIRNGEIWSQQGAKLTATDATADSNFGSGVSLSFNGVTALIGAPNLANAQSISAVGAGYIFTRNNGVWSQLTKLLATDGVQFDQLGENVALSSNATYAILSARGADSEKGSAYIFFRENTTWTQQTEIKALDGVASDKFGVSVAINSNGRIALVGAPNNSSSKGAAYGFIRNGTNWFPYNPKLVGSDSVDFNEFGSSVALNTDGSIALAGARKHNSQQGAIYAFSDPLLVATNTPTASQTSTTGPATSTPDGTTTPGATATSDGTTTPGATSTPDGTTTPGATSTPDGTTTPGATATETPIPGTELIVNGDFEAEDAAGAVLLPWIQKGALADKIKCNKDKTGDGDTNDAEDKIVAWKGDCAYAFKGGVGENSKIQQSTNPSLVTYAVNDSLTLSLYVNASNPAAAGKVKLRVKYGDTSIATGKITLTIAPTTGYAPLSESYTLASANVTKIKVQVQNTSAAGKVYVDDVSLRYIQASAGLLPLP